jgi:hypothetical protein
MALIATIFDTQAKVDAALKSVYDSGIDEDNVTMLRDEGIQGDSQVSGTRETNIPLGAAGLANTNTGGLGANEPALGAVALAIFDRYGLGQDERAFYTQQADRGAVVLLIEVDDDNADETLKLVQQHHPTRADRIAG